MISYILTILFTVLFLSVPQPAAGFEPDFEQGVDIRSVINETKTCPACEIHEIYKPASDASDAGLTLGTKDPDKPVWISVSDADIAVLGDEFNFSSRKSLAHGNMVSIFKVKESELDELSDIMHRRFHKCGGFFAHTLFESAQNDTLAPPPVLDKTFTIDQAETVVPMLRLVNETSISKIITTLSAYKNRYYRSESGVKSAKWLADYWKELAKDRPDISVLLYRHASWPQESVILTVKSKATPPPAYSLKGAPTNVGTQAGGRANPEQVVVLGGHFDSIAGWGSSDPIAPGADDNASGIAVLTETIRVMVKAGYKPKMTLKFIAYAAEEVGLRGSREIADAFKKEGVDVQGVIQFDMANYKGSADDIYLISDHTNSNQNAFLGNLIKTYTNYTWGETRCGYACSDHASWTTNGFIASFPFETKMGEDNPNIHSAKDTLDQMGGNSLHAFKFTKLSIAYMVEIAK